MPARNTDSRMRYYHHSISCNKCGKVFAASRYDAKYCSAECRAYKSNQRKELKRRVDHIKESIRSVKEDFGRKHTKDMKLNDRYDLRWELLGELTEVKNLLLTVLDSIS